jgi:nitroimidazol reductase NimA-like FMN-containing flavoprotein (pyridoxamine 5'-phosphate oxidase superfamily)
MATEPAAEPAHDPSTGAAPTPRTQVRRLPELGAYDRATIHAILDEALVCHLGFVHDDQPFVIPTLHARIGEDVYVHGSAASRTLRTLASPTGVCLTVTLIDGLVLARSVFEHSVNYRSVVILGEATMVETPGEKLRVLEAFTEQLIPGRWADARQPTEQELKATTVLRLPLDECSAKVNDGPPDDGESEDALLDIWAGNIPFRIVPQPPVPDPTLKPGPTVPNYATHYTRPGWDD